MATTDELVDVLGEEGFDRLAQRWGGAILKIPGKMHEAHEIARLCGLEAATRLASSFGPGQIYVPLGHLRKRLRERIEIIRRYKAGETLSGIARAMACSRTRVMAVIDRPEPAARARDTDNRQADLFG
jgi:Mor family transcriptional regulator